MDKEVVVHLQNGISLSYKTEHIWVSSNEVGEPGAYYIEWNKWERERQILYINACVERSLGVGDGQRSLACCSPWGLQESDMTEQLNCMHMYGI